MVKYFLFSLILSADGMLYADHSFRMDLRNIKCVAEPAVSMIAGEGLRVGKAGRNDGLSVEGSKALAKDSWRQVTFTFTPETDGAFELWLRGPYSRRKGKDQVDKLWVIYDDLKVTGAEIRNGDFELVSEKNADHPQGWRMSGKGACRVEDAVSGRFGVKVFHDGLFAQTVKVKANTPVTITFSAKCGEIELVP